MTAGCIISLRRDGVTIFFDCLTSSLSLLYELLQRVITVSLETIKIVNNLPKLDLKEV